MICGASESETANPSRTKAAMNCGPDPIGVQRKMTCQIVNFANRKSCRESGTIDTNYETSLLLVSELVGFSVNTVEPGQF
jgi:hypothetical protein